jgi:hypothetical protein
MPVHRHKRNILNLSRNSDRLLRGEDLDFINIEHGRKANFAPQRGTARPVPGGNDSSIFPLARLTKDVVSCDIHRRTRTQIERRPLMHGTCRQGRRHAGEAVRQPHPRGEKS